MHSDELTITLPLVRALVDRANPGWQDLPVTPLGSTGSSNALFRLGSELLVRLPRQPGGSIAILKESRWLPVVAAALPVATPEVVLVGDPSADYPEHWSVVRWLPGVLPTVDRDEAVTPRTELAVDLAGAVDAFRGIAVPKAALDAPELRWYRGEPVQSHDADTRALIDECRAIPGLGIDLDQVAATWQELMRTVGGRSPSPDHWFHGDLLAENLLVGNGRLAAILDFGGLAIGDPAIDLVVAWELLDPAERQIFRGELDVDDTTWAAGKAWALSLAIMTFPYYWRTMPGRCADRRAMLDAVLTDA